MVPGGFWYILAGSDVVILLSSGDFSRSVIGVVCSVGVKRILMHAGGFWCVLVSWPRISRRRLLA
jgi:hypothetical protein